MLSLVYRSMLLCLRLREARARITAASSTGVVQSSTASPLLVACAAQSRRQLTLRALQSAEQPMAGGGALRRRRQPCVFQRAGAASWSCPRRAEGSVWWSTQRSWQQSWVRSGAEARCWATVTVVDKRQRALGSGQRAFEWCGDLPQA
jgi:hypothetical protein